MCTPEDRQFLDDNGVCDIFEMMLQHLLQEKPSKEDIPSFLCQVLCDQFGCAPVEGQSKTNDDGIVVNPVSVTTHANQSPRARLQQEDAPTTLRITYGLQNMRKNSLQEISFAFEDIEAQVQPQHTDLLIVDHYSTASLEPIKKLLLKHRQITSLVFISCTFLASGEHGISALHEPLTGGRCGVSELAFDGCSFVAKANAWKPGAEDDANIGTHADALAAILADSHKTSIRSLFLDQMNSRGVQVIFQALTKADAPLLDLVLTEAQLDATAMSSLSAMIKTNCVLQGLSLSNSTFIGDEMGVAIAIGMTSNKALRCIDISLNTSEGDLITQDGISEIVKSLEGNPNHQLADLYVAIAGSGGPHLSSSWQQRLQNQLKKNAHLLSDPTIALLPVNFWRGGDGTGEE